MVESVYLCDYLSEWNEVDVLEFFSNMVLL